MALSSVCTGIANQAFAAFAALPAGYTLVAYTSGNFVFYLTTDPTLPGLEADAGYFGVMSTVATSATINTATKLATALQAALIDPNPQDAPWRDLTAEPPNLV